MFWVYEVGGPDRPSEVERRARRLTARVNPTIHVSGRKAFHRRPFLETTPFPMAVEEERLPTGRLLNI